MKKHSKHIIVLLSFLFIFSFFVPKINNFNALANDYTLPQIYQHFNYSTPELKEIISGYDSNLVELGSIPYLIIDTQNLNENTVLYNQKLNSNSKNISFIIKGDNIFLRNLSLGINTNDSFKMVIKPFSELKNNSNNNLKEISTNFVFYEINLENTFNDEVYYNSDNTASNTLIKDSFINEISILNSSNTTGTLFIQSISSTTENSDEIVWNDFTNGTTVLECANSNTTYVETIGNLNHRSIKLNPFSKFDLIKSTLLDENYKYLIIEGYGDLENLEISYTLDKTNFVNNSLYEPNMNIESCYGFRFAYNKSENVTITRIYVSKYNQNLISEKIPYLDTNIKFVDSFNVEQTVFYDSISKAKINQSKIFSSADCEYRISKNFINYVKIQNNQLVFDKTSLNANDIVNFTAKYNVKYENEEFLVLKVKADDNILTNFEISLNSTNYVSSDCLLVSYGYKTPFDNTNPYTTNDGYKLILINIKESEFNINQNQEFYVSINYLGTSTFVIDEMFLTNSLKEVEVQKSTEFENEQINFSNENGTKNINLNILDYNKLSLTITSKTEKLENLTLSFDNNSFELSQILLNDNSTLSNLKLSENTPKSITINLNSLNLSNTTKFSITASENITLNVCDFVLIKTVEAKNYEDNNLYTQIANSFPTQNDVLITDTVKPVIIYNGKTEFYNGKITLSYNIFDNETSLSDLNFSVQVKNGNNTLNFTQKIENNLFIIDFVAQNGEYEISITVTDENQNSRTSLTKINVVDNPSVVKAQKIKTLIIITVIIVVVIAILGVVIFIIARKKQQKLKF